MPGLEDRVSVRFSSRLQVSLGRCTPSRRSIRLHRGLDHGPEELLLEVLCHELAHVAAFDLFGPAIRPHGAEWKELMRQAGYRPTVRLDVPPGVLPHPRRRRRHRRRYLYVHRCPVCHWSRQARAAARRWRCPGCTEAGRGGELEIWRRGASTK